MRWRFGISVAIVFILLFLLGWLVHGTWLKDDYARLSNLMRPMPEVWIRSPLMFLAQLCSAFGFVWIYVRGKEDKPWLGQGVRFGVAVALLATIPVSLIHYVNMPFPHDLILKQLSCDVATVVFLGIVVAWINRSRSLESRGQNG